MSHPKPIDDKFAQAVLSLEEAIFDIADIFENHISEISEKEKEDLITVQELVESARNLAICVIASTKNKKPPF